MGSIHPGTSRLSETFLCVVPCEPVHATAGKILGMERVGRRVVLTDRFIWRKAGVL
jgi:hypothetical protein